MQREKPRDEFTLASRYSDTSGVVFLSGIQALVRLPMDQRRLDEANGLNTAGFISGYRGSPLGGLDKQLWAERDALSDANVVFKPGLNEDLAATAVWGSQQVGLFEGARYDGVFGMWYGKAPGLDRSCDAIRHANFAGTAKHGGVLLVVGDDHGCKSSTLPSASEQTLRDLGVPVLNPADVQDVLDFGLAGWALSRYAGVWAGLVALADTMDSAATVTLSGPARWLLPESPDDTHIRLGDAPLDQEARMFEHKLARVREFAAVNELNRLITNPRRAELVVVTTGKAYLDTRQALAELGLRSEHDLTTAGVRLVKLGMSWPLDRDVVRGFCGDARRVLVIEEKRGFVEDGLKTALYGGTATPLIEGKLDADGRVLFPAAGEIDVAHIATVLAARLSKVPNSSYLERLQRQRRELDRIGDAAARTPFYCAGCPHNKSTRVPEGSRAGAGIGCHYMAQWMDRETHTVTQMGGEGANWIGQSPFTDEQHVFVNLGDGTYFHSGLLAIRAAVAAGVNVTYKILFNDAVAMTGGQPLDGNLTVPAIVAQLHAEGVREIRVLADDPSRHSDEPFDVLNRAALDAVQRELRQVPGCSVLIYDEVCATEQRRRRKRGLAQSPGFRVMINDAVCEGCGDCSVQSSCVAVEPLETEFGTKRAISQTACNLDLACTDGLCPSFVRVRGVAAAAEAAGADKRDDYLTELAEIVRLVPDPLRLPSESADILITGIGGTGIVTLSALLGTAAHLDGKRATTLDMTGLAQKGGAVFGQVRISDAQTYATRIPAARASVLIGADLITAGTPQALAALAPEDTIAVVNSHVAPTAEFVLSQKSEVNVQKVLRRLRRFARTVHQVDSDGFTRSLFGSAATANVFLLGYTFQRGVLPLSLAALERAIRLNGVAVEDNLASFHLGRLAAHDPEALPAAARRPGLEAMSPPVSGSRAERMASLRRHLTEYQDSAYADRFERLVRRVADREMATRRGSTALTEATMSAYAALLTYKDEYEVARLYSDGRFVARLESEFGRDRADLDFSILLAPPLLARRDPHTGRPRKVAFGPWVLPVLKLLARGKRLRKSRFDPFRWSRDRRLDRALLARFEQVVDQLVEGMEPGNLDVAVEVISAFANIRGFGIVKERGAEQALQMVDRKLATFAAPAEGVKVFDPSLEAA